MTPAAFLLTLRPALPFSVERPCQVASNGEVARWVKNRAVWINGAPASPDAQLEPCQVRSLVLFPNSPRRRCTLV